MQDAIFKEVAGILGVALGVASAVNQSDTLTVRIRAHDRVRPPLQLVRLGVHLHGRHDEIKARSRDVNPGDAALFSAISHEIRTNYYFVFYSERLDTTWLMTSEEFLAESWQNKSGKNVGLRSIWFNGKRRDRETGRLLEHVHPRFDRYVVTDFSRLLDIASLGTAPSAMESEARSRPKQRSLKRGSRRRSEDAGER